MLVFLCVCVVFSKQRNKLTEYPAALGGLPGLRVLNVMQNRITSLAGPVLVRAHACVVVA